MKPTIKREPVIPTWLWWGQWVAGFTCGTAFGLFVAAARVAA